MAVDADIVWGAAYDGTAPTNACVDVTVTSNGGTLWTAKTLGVTQISIANLCAIDANKCWAVCYYPSGSGTKDGIYYTSNGGTTWTQQTTAAFANSASFPNCVWFWDANNGYCMGDPISGDFEIYTTTNGGTTWTQVPGANIPNPVSGEFGVVGYQSIVGNTVWFGTNKGRIYKSTDRGLNWTVATCTPINNKYIQPFFKDANFGLVMDKDAATTGFLAMSTDGGATFTSRNNIGNTFTNDMDYVPATTSTWVSTGADATNGYAGVSYSFDDGANWFDMAETIGSQFLATEWVDNATGWAGSFVDGTTMTGGMYKFNKELVAPEPVFTASDTAVALGDPVTFTDASTGNITAWQWTFQGGTPATSNVQNPPAVVFATPGAHDVTLKVTNAWGNKTLLKNDYIYVGGVGMNELAASAVVVYPNPVKESMNVSSSFKIEQVTISNMVGQTVYTQTASSNLVTVNGLNLKAGVYTVKVKTAEGVATKKIVVN